jgi:hypothetical protein
VSGLVTLVVGAALLAAAVWTFLSGFRALVGTSSPDIAGGLGQLLRQAVAAGLVAAAITEALKHLTTLRRSVHLAAIRRFFGDPWYLIDQPRAFAVPARSDVDASLPALAVAVTTPERPTYGAPTRQLTAQLSQILRAAVTALPQVEGDRQRDVLSLVLGPGQPTGGLGQRPLAELTDVLTAHVDRRLDTFLIDTQTRWRTLLRVLSATIAAVLLALGAWADHRGATGIWVGLWLGFAVSGPIAWTARDLARLVERRAQA